MIRHALLLGSLLTFTAVATASSPEAAILDRWQGTYLCTQGWTGLDLTIERASDPEPGRELEATFAFYEIDRNPGVPSGRFVMRGHFAPEDGHLDLAQDRWLQRPERYVMVDLHGVLHPERETLAGRISGPGCGSFELRRAEGPPTPDSWLLGR